MNPHAKEHRLEPSKKIDKRKHILWVIITLIIAGITIAAVFSRSETMTLEELHDLFWNGHPVWLILAFLCMIGYMVFEGLSLNTLLKSVEQRTRLKNGIVYGAADAYFSAITPSATGGQPAVMYFMIKYGVPVAVAMAILVINLILYNVSTIVLGILVFVTQPEVFHAFNPLSKTIIILGFVAVTGLGIGLILLLKKGEWMAELLIKLVKFVHRKGFIKNPEKLIERIRTTEKDYDDAEELMSGKPLVVLVAGIYNMLQRITLILVPVFMDMAISNPTGRPLTVWAIQCYVAVGANCIPIPGAMGAYDYLMIDGYHNLMSPERVYRLAILSRSMSFYLCVIISSIIVLVAYLRTREEASR